MVAFKATVEMADCKAAFAIIKLKVAAATLRAMIGGMGAIAVNR